MIKINQKRANELSMVQFAKSYAPYVILLESKRLAEQVKNDKEQPIQGYDKINERRKMIMNEEKENVRNAVRFLMYSYFGDWKADLFYAPFYSAISRAYRDATMRGALNLSVQKTEDDDTDKKNKEDSDIIKTALEIYATEVIHQAIVSYIGCEFDSDKYITDYKWDNNIWDKNDVLKNEFNDAKKKVVENKSADYSDWHKNLCKTLTDFYGIYAELMEGDSDKLENPFSIGNAQKWVNMTMKYLYIMGSLLAEGNDHPVWCDKVLEESENFHVPLDSYILKALFNKSMSEMINCNYGRKLIEDKSADSEKNFSVDGNGHIKEKNGRRIVNDYGTWSSFKKYGDYENIQKAVKGKIPEEFKSKPLIWENKVWILAAEIIKK